MNNFETWAAERGLDVGKTVNGKFYNLETALIYEGWLAAQQCGPRRRYIPQLGDTVKLEQPWTFDLHCEGRNQSLFIYFGLLDFAEIASVGLNAAFKNHFEGNSVPVTLPAGTELKIDRIYIRKGAEEFGSVTFVVPAWKTTKQSVVVRKKASYMTAVQGSEESYYKKVFAGLNPCVTTSEESSLSEDDMLTAQNTNFRWVDVEYDSTKQLPSSAVRFWSKLNDVNSMVLSQG